MSAVIRLVFLVLTLIPIFAFASGSVLSPDGYGLLRFGMKVREAEIALKQRTSAPYAKEGCDYVEFKRYPGLRFMVEDDILTRADARKGVRNSASVKVGMTAAKVKELHPEVRVEPHQYDDDGHYLILETANGRAAIVLEESKGKVTDVRAGLNPSVQYVEGCL